VSAAVARWRGPLLLALIVAALAHLALVVVYPRALMQLTMQAMSQHGERLHRWLHAPPVTPAARRIVRPGPEFAYSACVYDLSRGPLHIHVPASTHYWSLSLYAANTDNFRVERDVEHPQGLDLTLAYGAAPSSAVQAPSARGIALLRRLATDDAAWTEVNALRKEDACTSVE
jgi:uncharacterized membrane protein